MPVSWWNGDSWRWHVEYHPPPLRTTIAVIEPPSPSYDEYAERKARQKDAKRVPWGFARALLDDEETAA